MARARWTAGSRGSLALAATILLSCNAVWGVDDLRFGAASSEGAGGLAGGGGAQTGGAGGEAVGGAAGTGNCPANEQCVPTTPGAQLVFVLQEGAPIDASCTAGWDFERPLYLGTDPGCGTCGCGAAVGGQCSLQVTRYSGVECASLLITLSSTDGACISPVSVATGYGVAAPTATEGECTPDWGAPAPIPYERACGLAVPTGPACGLDHVCVPSTEPTLGRVCVKLADSGAVCPEGYSPVGTRYEQATDGRSCSCSCAAASGAGCAGQAMITLYTLNDCAGAEVRDVGVDPCASNGVGAESYRVNAGSWTGGTCSAQDESTGTVAFVTPVSLCCLE